MLRSLKKKIHGQNKRFFKIKYDIFMECVLLNNDMIFWSILLNNDMIFIEEIMYK